ncbi:MAG: undecaprenyl-diphosphate phosphatase [Bacteroidales bacterium]|nr:undecaprenyl-diphosphate phosphatase [Bacteroidales bacterium]
MNLLEAIILGIIQGLTEFLPVSSSGHLELGKYLFGVDAESSFAFSVAVHGATVLSTLVVFRMEIMTLIRGTLKFRYNDETKYTLQILVSLIPVLIVGLFFKDQVEALFNGNIIFVGVMLMVTATMLIGTYFLKDRGKGIGYVDAFIIGIAQALAVIPGISRSGATISTGIILGNRRDNLAKFSFLMVLIPVIGINLLDLVKGEFTSSDSIAFSTLAAGFVAAFVTGFLACRWMIEIVRKGKLIWFGIYCMAIGLLAVLIG